MLYLQKVWNEACAAAKFSAPGASVGEQMDAAVVAFVGVERVAVAALVNEAWRRCRLGDPIVEIAACLELVAAMMARNGRVLEALRRTPVPRVTVAPDVAGHLEPVNFYRFESYGLWLGVDPKGLLLEAPLWNDAPMKLAVEEIRPVEADLDLDVAAQWVTFLLDVGALAPGATCKATRDGVVVTPAAPC